MSGEVILLVEDNQDDIDLTIEAFRRNRIMNAVKVVQDGIEAIDYLFATGDYAGQAHSPLPAIVILDLNLPKMSGIDVLRRIRASERTRLLPVVVLTTSTEDRDVIQSYKLGANAYVQKPVGFEDFIKAAGSLGLFWLLLNVRASEKNRG